MTKKQDPRAHKARKWFGKGVQGLSRGPLQDVSSAFAHAYELFSALITGGFSKFRIELAHMRMRWGDARAVLDDPAGASVHYAEAAGEYEALIGKGHSQLRLHLAYTYRCLADVVDLLDDPYRAIAHYVRAAAIYETLIGEGFVHFRADLALAWMSQGVTLNTLQRLDESLRLFEQAATYFQLEIDEGKNQYREEIARTRMNWGVALLSYHHIEEAIEKLENSVAIYQSLIESRQNHIVPSLAKALMNLGIAFQRQDRTEDSLRCYALAAKMYQELLDAGEIKFGHNLSITLTNWTFALLKSNRVTEAASCSEQAALTFQTLIAGGKSRFRSYLATAWIGQGAVLTYGKQEDEALKYYALAATELRALVDAGKLHFRANLAHAYYIWGTALFNLNRLHEALDQFRQAAVVYQDLLSMEQSQYGPQVVRSLIASIIAMTHILVLEPDCGKIDKAQPFLDAIAGPTDQALAVLCASPNISLEWLRSTSFLDKTICLFLSVDFARKARRFAEYLARVLNEISPIGSSDLYPIVEQHFICLLNEAMERELWDLALTLVGTARAQRLAKLAKAELLQRAEQADAPDELQHYRQLATRLAALETLLTVRSGTDAGGFIGGRGLDGDMGQDYARLNAEYTDTRRQLDALEQTLRTEGLLPDLGSRLFDGAALRARLAPAETIAILLQSGTDDDRQPRQGVLLLTRDQGQVLTLESLSPLGGRLARFHAALVRGTRGLRKGPQESPALAVGAATIDPRPVDVQAEELTLSLAQAFWEPVTQALGRDRSQTVWLIPAGDLHGLPWQASAPPLVKHCRIVPAPWFVQQALDARQTQQESPPCDRAPCHPSATAPLGVLAYEAPTGLESHSLQPDEEPAQELFFLDLERALLQAVWSTEVVQPLADLEAAQPSAEFLVLAGHGQSHPAIPGAARIWVGRADDGARSYVGFGELWRSPLKPQFVYCSSCTVGLMQDIAGEPLGLPSAALLRGARYVIGWTVPVNDLGVALFSLLYHWAWREHQDPEIALKVARQAFLRGEWPDETKAIAQEQLGLHVESMIKRYLAVDLHGKGSRIGSQAEVRKVLKKALKDVVDVVRLTEEPADTWESWVNCLIEWPDSKGDPQSIEELRQKTQKLAAQLIECRCHFPFRYLANFALGLGSFAAPHSFQTYLESHDADAACQYCHCDP
ncbi:CHAT domain-containing protein [uncultured Thiocystis sp.]|jgi:tetratricopeptide (TPR) repeat protein|uniref:CHAT domain-containing protein n=1 Tax=uncultured Thiocystis sp. TaxID=1202134 RepID=UPI0025D0BDF5|nr:CHAT domain-containing protein [uncultured Thiocystis sp.]